MSDVVSLIVFPPESKGFALRFRPWRFINNLQVISIWSWFFLRVSENNSRDRFSIPLAESTTFWSQRSRNLRLQYVTIVRAVVLETTVFWKTVFLWTMTPSSSGLVPSRTLLGHADMGIAEQNWAIGTVIIVEVSSMRLVAAHVVSGNHTLVFANPLLTCHHNKFKQVIL